MWEVSSVFIPRLLPNSGSGKGSPLAHFVTACLSAADTVTQVLQTDYVWFVRVSVCECSDLANKKQNNEIIIMEPDQAACCVPFFLSSTIYHVDIISPAHNVRKELFFS